MKALYQEVILDHYKHPVGKGLRTPFTDQAHQVNPICGDEILMRLMLDDDIVEDISYDCQGCSISQASASVLAERITGLEVDYANTVIDAFLGMLLGDWEPNEDLLGDGVAFEGVKRYPARIACALIPWKAVRKML